MSDDRPNPLTDIIKGLGLILRAAKTTVERLPSKDLEEVVLTSAREVGRALENVATTVEREVFGRKRDGGKRGSQPPPATPTPPPPPSSDPGKDDPKPPDAA